MAGAVCNSSVGKPQPGDVPVYPSIPGRMQGSVRWGGTVQRGGCDNIGLIMQRL